MTGRQFLFFLLSVTAIAFASTSQALLPPQEVNNEEFPSSVAFVLVSNLSKCTATKVAPKTFLTAAHCFDQFQRGSEISIEQISHKQMKLEVRTRITQLKIHPFFSAHPGKINRLAKTAIAILPDVAVFTTADDVNVPIAKLNFDRLQLAQDILVGGYGAQGKEYCYPILHPCSLNMADQKVRFIKSLFFYTAPDQRFPHFLTEGDSGGPAYIRNRATGELEVVGINSMMTPASAKQAFDMIFTSNQRANPPRTASIYVRISELEPWIWATIHELTKKH